MSDEPRPVDAEVVAGPLKGRDQGRLRRGEDGTHRPAPASEASWSWATRSILDHVMRTGAPIRAGQAVTINGADGRAYPLEPKVTQTVSPDAMSTHIKIELEHRFVEFDVGLREAVANGPGYLDQVIQAQARRLAERMESAMMGIDIGTGQDQTVLAAFRRDRATGAGEAGAPPRALPGDDKEK